MGSTAIPIARDLGFLQGGGELARMMRRHDWSATPLGPPEQWPQSLRTVIRTILSSRFAMWMAWGPELTFFCNDAYRPTLGTKQGWLGAPSDRVWEEIWPDIGPRIGHVLRTGEATWDESLLLLLERSGFREETYHTFSYSPLADDRGAIAGMLCVVTEVTERVIGERRLHVLRDLGLRIADARNSADVWAAVEACLASEGHDLPCALGYTFDGADRRARLASAAGIARGAAAAPESLDLDRDDIWQVGRTLAGEGETLVADLDVRFAGLPAGPWDKAPAQALILPIAAQGQADRPIGAFIAGLNPYRPLDADYRGFLGLLVSQIAAGLANAGAYEAERRRAEALSDIDRAKTAFFSNISHEFRTPLALMLGPLEDALGDSNSLPPAQLARIDTAHRNSLRLLRLVNALLDFSRIEAGRVQASFRPTDLAGLTADLVSSFRSATDKAGLRLIIDCATPSRPVHVDRDMWEKIVLNLVSNAFKFTFEGEIAVALREQDGVARLTVRDTGTGIPPEELPRLFERFHRVQGARGRSFEGSGIGLALVQELVRLHGGEVRVESEVGRGTMFTVDIPFGTVHLPPGQVETAGDAASTSARVQSFAEEALRWLPGGAGGDAILDADAAASGGAVGGSERERIVVVDDNADLRDYIGRLLASAGYAVQALADGEAALSALRISRPDLVVSDVMMPRLDGIGLLKAIRNDPALRDLPVILLSARAGEEARIDGLESGADDYLTKPFSARELVARVGANLSMARIRREAAAAIRTTEARSAAVLEGMGEGYVLLGRDFRVLQINREGLRMDGRPASEILGKTHWEAWPDTGHTEQGTLYRKAMAERVPVTLDVYRDRPDGVSGWIEVRVYPAQDGEAGGGASDGGLAIFYRDITDRKRSEAELQRLNAALEQRVVESTAERDRLWRNSRDLLLVIGKDGIFRSASPAWTTILGWAPEEVVGRSHLDFIHPDDHRISLAALATASRTVLQNHENRYRHKDGSYRWISWLAAPENDLIYATGRHITAEKEAAEALRRSEARLRTIFQTSHQYQGLLAPDGTLLDANATALAGIEATLPDVIGQPFWDTPWFSGTPGMPETIRAAVAAVARGETVRREIEVTLPNKGWRIFDFAMRPIAGDGGAIVALVPEAIDITERRHAEERLRQAQKIEAIGQLTGGVAHDFNNLLMVISGGLDLIGRIEDAEKRARVLGGMRQAVARGSGLSRQLLAFSRRQALSPRPIDLARQIGGMRELLDRSLRGDVHVVTEFADGLWPVEVDPGELELVILNLAVNARDAMPDGGTITISAKNEAGYGEASDGSPAGDFVRLSVTDTGTGMSPDVLARVFDPFFTTKDVGKGSGLGLAQTHGFVHASGGAIRIDSTPGQGTTVSLLLPRTHKVPTIEDPLPPLPAVESRPPAPRGRVLVVEDDDEVAALTSEMIRQLGYDTTRVASAEAALGALANGRPIDLVFSDVMMPGPMNGLALAREIRRRRPGLPVLLTSGYADAARPEAEAEHIEILAKPYRLVDLDLALAALARNLPNSQL
jgi:PAS domain S-box-containing protein